MRSWIPWLTAVLIVVFDRITKMMILEHIAVGSRVAVMPGLTLTHVHNRGIAFSLFADGGWMTRIVIHSVIFSAVFMISAMPVILKMAKAFPTFRSIQWPLLRKKGWI